jgi:uncharacterized protein (TIGR03437 family)
VETFLRQFCTVDSNANPVCDGYVTGTEIPNLWRLIAFSGGALEILPILPSDATIREALSGNSPVLLSLRLASGEAAAAVATGVDRSGEIQIMDPSPRNAQTSLGAYRAAGAALLGAARFVPRPAIANGFLIAIAGAETEVASGNGRCGVPFPIPARPAAISFGYCDGAETPYQLQVTGPDVFRGTVTDLAEGGARFEIAGLRSGFFLISRPSASWELSTLETSFQPTNILNAASFNPDIAPGAAISIFGLGLSRANMETRVEIGGLPARILFATPFQLNAVVPLELAPGPAQLRVTSFFGTAEAPLEIRAAAPALFRFSTSQAAITNQDGQLNTPGNPARRGEVVVVYGTGFGAVEAQPGGNLLRTVLPVTARVAGVDVPVVYAGLTPGAAGLYQLNLTLPADLPPGLSQSLEIRQAGVTASTAQVAIR